MTNIRILLSSALGVALSSSVGAGYIRPLQAPPASTPGTGLIVGRVVDATTDKPIVGAIVNLNGGATRVRVDSKGQFLFRNLAGGAYTLSAEKAGYVYGRYGQLRPTGVGQPLDLADGERVTDVVIKVWRLSAIEGAVIDERGEPAPGARVQALPVGNTAGHSVFPIAGGANGISDDRGVYHLGGLVPGTYLIVTMARTSTFPVSYVAEYAAANAAGDAASRAFQNKMALTGAWPMDGATIPAGRAGDLVYAMGMSGDLVSAPGANNRLSVYPTTYAPGSLTPDGAARITVAAGEMRSGVDLQVRAVPAIRVSGIAAGPDGPIAGLGIRLFPATESLKTQSLFLPAVTVTDSSGAFTLLGVPPGQYTLFAQTGIPSIGPQQPLSKDPTLWAAVAIAAADKDLTSLAIVLRPTLHVSGRVEFEGTTAKPPAPRMTAIRLWIDPVDGRSQGPALQPRFQTQIDAAGGFYTSGLRPGKYFVHVDGAQGAPALPAGWYLKSATIDGRDVTNDAPLVLESSDVDGLVVTFTDHPSRLSGTVRDANGAPDRSAEVLVFSVESAQWADGGAFPTRLRSVTAGRSGAYALPNLPAGDYYAIAIPAALAGDWQDPKFLSRVASGALRVHINDGASVTLDLKTIAVPR